MRLAAILLLLIAGAAEAQNKAVVQITQPGAYLITTDAAGNISIERVASITVGGGTIPTPTPDPVPDPTPDDDRSKLVHDLIQALPPSNARHQTAIKFAGTLKLISEQVANGTVPPAAIEHVYGPLMAISVPEAGWKHIHDAVLEGLKGISTPAANATALEQYAAGAMQTVPNQADPGEMRSTDAEEIQAASEEYGFDWSMILKMLLPLILALMQKWLSFIKPITDLLYC
jgi:hypothetical protein